VPSNCCWSLHVIKKIWFHAGSLNVNQVFLFAGLPAPNFQPKALWILIWGPCFVSRLLCVTYSERGKVAAAPLPPLGGDTERKSAAFLPSLGLDRKGARRHLRKWHRSFLFRLNSCSSLCPSVRRPYTRQRISIRHYLCRVPEQERKRKSAHKREMCLLQKRENSVMVGVGKSIHACLLRSASIVLAACTPTLLSALLAKMITNSKQFCARGRWTSICAHSTGARTRSIFHPAGMHSSMK
jgi:hypothetical protein